MRFLGDLESLDNAAITFEGRYGHQFSHPWIPITNIEFTFFNSKTSFLDNWHLLTTPNFQWSLWSPIENHQTGILAGMTFDYTRASYKGDALFQELFYGPMIGWWWQTKWTNFGIIEAHFKYHLQESFHLKTSYFTVSCQYVWEL